MAVFPDRIVLKNSTDAQAAIETAIGSGGSDAIVQGELVVGLGAGTVDLYTIDSNGDVVRFSPTSASGRAIVSDTEPTLGINNQPLAEGDLWYESDTGFYYVYYGAAWVQVSGGALTDLTDVVVTSPSTGQVLEYNGTNWVNAAGGATGIDDLTDVDTSTTAPTDGQVLTWVDANSKWEPATPSDGGATTLGALTDVQAPTAGDNNISSVTLLVKGDGSVVDQSPSAHTLSNTNVTSNTIEKKYGSGSLEFTGNSALQPPAGSDFDFSATGGTIECWFRITSYPGALAQLFGPHDSTLWAVWINASNDLVFWHGADRMSFASPSLNTWHHVALTYNPTGTEYRLYLDGVDSGASYTATAWDRTGLRFGSRSNNATYFTGLLDEIRVTKGVLRYTGAYTPPTEGFGTGIGSPVDGQVLTWNDANSRWEPADAAGGVSTLDGLTDVDTSTVAPTDGQFLAWDNTAGQWEPADGSTVAAINDLTDVASQVTEYSYVTGGYDVVPAVGEYSTYSGFGAKGFKYHNIDGNGNDADNDFPLYSSGEVYITYNGTTSARTYTNITPDGAFPGQRLMSLDAWPSEFSLSGASVTPITFRKKASVNPVDGQVLTWVDANSQWEPVTPGAASVSNLSDIGDVSLTGTEYITTGKYTSTGSFPGGGQYRIWTGSDPDILQIRTTDSLGTDNSAALGQISTGDTFEASADGATGWITITALSDATLASNVYDINISDADTTAISGLGSSLYFRFKVPAAKVDGDYLVWNDGDATWEPGKAVATVNGQSGAAVLGVNDLNNFSGWLKYTVDDSGTSSPAAGTLSINFVGWDIFFSMSDAEGGGYYTEYGTLVATDTMEIIFADKSSTTAIVNSTGNYSASSISVNFTDNTFLTNLSNGDTVYLRFPGRFGGTSASDGQVLTWVDANSQWESVGVSLGVEDLNNVGANVLTASWQGDTLASMAGGMTTGEFFNEVFTLNLHPISQEGDQKARLRAWIATLSATPTLTVAFDGVEQTISVNVIEDNMDDVAAYKPRLRFAHSTTPLFSASDEFVGQTLVIREYDAFLNANYGGPVDGQVLSWVDADSQWKPADYISKATLKAEAAAATDFADFQARIAAL